MEKAFSRARLVVVTLLLASLLDTCSGGGAPPPAADCSAAVLSLAECLAFVQEGGFATSTPQGGCCSGLKKAVETDVRCVCDGIKTAAAFGVKINMTRASSLPTACGISSSALAECNSSGASTASAGAPAPSPVPPSLAKSPVPVETERSSSAPVPTHAEPATIEIVLKNLLLCITAAMAALYI